MNYKSNYLAFGATTNKIILGDDSSNTNAVTLEFSSAGTFNNPIELKSGTSGTIKIKVNNTVSNCIFTGGVTGNNDLTLTTSCTSTNYSQYFQFTTNPIDIAGQDGLGGTLTIDSGTATIGIQITGGIGSNVKAITYKSTRSPFTINTTAITVNSTYGTTLTNTGGGTFTVSGGVGGTGNLILNNNSGTDNAIIITTTAVNNTGTVTNTGTGSGSVTISTAIGPNVTGVVQNSATSSLILSGTNTYTSLTTVSAGDLSVTGSLNSGNDLTVSGGTATFSNNQSLGTVGNAGVVNFNGTTASVNTLGGSGTVNVSSATALTVNSGNFSGTIAGDGTLTKASSGTLTLSGSNSYAGTTTVSGGTLLVNGTHNGGGAYTVLSGVLGGTGSITASTVDVDGTLVAGDNASSTGADLTISGAVTVSGTLVSSLTSSGMSDQLVVNGTLDITGATLDMTLYDDLSTDAYLLVDYGTSSGNLTGTFGTVTFTTNGYSTGSYTTASINYDYVVGDHHYIALVPEPSTWVMLLTAGLMGGIGYWRRRRQAGREKNEAAS